MQQVFFAPSDARRVYMTSDVGGLFRSDDGGRSWRMLHGALPSDAGSYSPRGFVVHPRNANRILVATGSAWGSVNGVFVSNDGGNSWTQTLKAPFDGNGWYRSAGNVLAMSPHDTNLILAGPLGGGIQRSQDGGKTWQSSGPDDLNPVAIVFDRANARRVWVCAQPWGEKKVKRADGTEAELRGGLFVSNDAGRTWAKISDKSPEEIVQHPRDAQVLVGTMGEGRIMRSTDGGQNWTPWSEGLAPFGKGEARQDGTYAALAVGPDFVLAGGHGGHIYRIDGGSSTWREIKPSKISEGDWWGAISKHGYRHFGSALGFVAINPRNSKHWAFTDWYALYQSFDAGQTWNLTINGVEMVVLNTVAPEPSEPNVFHAGMADVGYFRSPDGGRTMQQVNRDISNNIKCIAPAPSQPGRVYATGPREWQWHANEVFISDDAGKSWRRSGLKGIPDMETRRSETVAPHPAKRDEVWVTISGAIKPGEGGPWRSLDGGQTWEWQGQGLSGDSFYRKDYWVSGPELAVSGDGSLVTTSNDRGLLARRAPGEDKWTMIEVPGGKPNCIASDPLTPGRFYAALQDGGLWRSDDGGRSWKNIVDRDINWVAPDFKVRNRLAAVAPWGVLVSTDAGKTWREASRALPYRHARNVVCIAGERIVVGTGGNGVFTAPIASLQGQATSRARIVAVANSSSNVSHTSSAPQVLASAQVQPDQPQDAAPLPVAIAWNDPSLQLQGRFDGRDAAGPRFAWPASTIALRFRGTALNVRMRDGSANRWQVEVDGKPTSVLQMREGEHLYRVAQGLPDGEHTVRLVKATEAIFGTSQLLGFELSQGARMLPVAAPTRRLEVIGDSISAGYGNEAASKEEHFSAQTQNAYFTYGAMAARALGAGYTCVAWSGKKMWPDNTLPEFYDRALPQDAASTWGFEAKPQAVVINLATNDFAAGIPQEAGWKAGYAAFIARVRAKYPQAQIYCAIGPMMGDWGPGDKPLSTLRAWMASIVRAENERGDSHVKVLDFGSQDAANGFGADWHPSIKTHQLMAQQLIQTLRADLKWDKAPATERAAFTTRE